MPAQGQGALIRQKLFGRVDSSCGGNLIEVTAAFFLEYGRLLSFATFLLVPGRIPGAQKRIAREMDLLQRRVDQLHPLQHRQREHADPGQKNLRFFKLFFLPSLRQLWETALWHGFPLVSFIPAPGAASG